VTKYGTVLETGEETRVEFEIKVLENIKVNPR
jgi:hypothetical protein